MTIIPCCQDATLNLRIIEFAEVLKTEAHKLGNHGLSEPEFYSSGLFRGAIERIRGQYSATMGPKREFVQHVLNHMEDENFIRTWERTEDSNRNDYLVELQDGRKAVIDLKGCLDGNNTTFSERPDYADEFVVWSVCTNRGTDPKKNAWSGLHTRLSSEIISKRRRVDGVVFWDMDCGTLNRPCPKLNLSPARLTAVGPFKVPPPCLYILPRELPTTTHVAMAEPFVEHSLLSAFSKAFNCKDEELNFVDFTLSKTGEEIMRQTTVRRGGIIQKQSRPTPIRRV